MRHVQRRVAIVGSGISGLAAAYALRDEAHVTLYEAADWFGGHAHTVDVTLPGLHGPVTHGVDTGFLVFNERTYPRLITLFDALAVRSVATEMSFSVQVPDRGLEWSGSDLNGVFAQRRNLWRPSFHRMLADILRFNRLATAIATRDDAAEQHQPIGDFLREHGFGDSFRDWYFLPMIGCIWSCPTDAMLRFPIATMIRFCHNHGLLQVTNRPRWFTVVGGSRTYVEKLLPHVPDARLRSPVRQVRRIPPGTGQAGVIVATDHGSEHVDEVVMACHADQTLALLTDVTPAEREVLAPMRYHRNRAVLHTDTSVLPRSRRAWAAWNYERAADGPREQASVCLHYLIDRLQPLPFKQPVIVSLNPVTEPRPGTVHGDFDYAHPVFDAAAIDAQGRLPTIQGLARTWFCGAWTGHGFHEDGLASGLAVADALRERWRSAAGALPRSAATA